MQKKIIIIIGAVVILLLLSVWAYLLFFGTPKNTDEIFSNFDMNGTEENFVATTTEDTPKVDISQSKLRQLTTKPVAGFNTITKQDGTSILYAEMGTGHIYSINTSSGEEKRISGTTVAGVNTAVISQNGDYVALGTKSNRGVSLNIGKISTSSNELLLKDFSTKVESFAITSSGTDLLYTTKDATGLSGHSYNFKSNTDKTIFTLPFHEAVIQWGNEANSTHYLYPKSTYLLEGYLYKVSNGKISRLPVSGYGLNALANDDIIAYSVNENSEIKNYIFNQKTQTTLPLSATILPEKCLIANVGYKVVCAWEPRSLPTEFPDQWYQGSLNFKDSIWNIYGDYSSVDLLVDTFGESGREIDIINIRLDDNEKAVYFINKNDNTLWMYEL